MTTSAEKKSNFFLGFLVLPRAKREALSAVYAYCRLIDDIVDSGHLKKDEARRMLDFWRGEVERLYAGCPTHSISQGLLPAVTHFRLPQEAFLEMIRGCEMDLNETRYETIEELEFYMKGVAGSVGTLAVDIFGYRYTPADRMREFAVLFGHAFQMTNILRDIGADLEIGRVYVPLAAMREAGYSVEALLRREHSPSFDRLMESLFQKARRYYQRARALVDFRDRPGLLPAEIMAHVYEGVLEEVRRTGFNVFLSPGKITRWRKLRLAFNAWRYCHGID